MGATIEDPPRAAAAGYTVLLDAPLSLGGGGDIDRTFDFLLPAAGLLTGEPAIVSFLLMRAVGLRLQVRWNDLNFTRDYGPGPERSVHEVIGPSARTGANQLTLLVHEGSCRLSDLVIWYRVQT